MASFSEFRIQRRVLLLLLTILIGAVFLLGRLAYVQLWRNDFFSK